MRVAMIGTGYVGLVSGACFPEFGFDVVCVDRDEDKIGRLGRGEIPIYEPGLSALIESNVKRGMLSFTTDLAAAVKGADVVFIVVGTPSRCGDGHADVSHVFAAAEGLASALDGYTVIVTKSTVPVGTGREVVRIIRRACPDAAFDVASNPEFLREGSGISDFMHPERIVIGTESERAREVLRRLYRPFHLAETPILFTSPETAEIIKYASNCFLATKVTFINEMADLCEKVGADVYDVARGIGLDGRIGRKFLRPGPGFGGSCFPKDALALVRLAQSAKSPLRIVETVISVNNARKKAMAERVYAACGGSLQGKTIAVLGLTFKPNTDDMRDSPSLEIVPALQRGGASVRAYDPKGMDEAKKLFDGVVWCESPYDAMTGADALTIVTEWNEFRSLDLDRVKALMNQPVVVDLRNIYNPAELAAAGLEYTCLGRAASGTCGGT